MKRDSRVFGARAGPMLVLTLSLIVLSKQAPAQQHDHNQAENRSGNEEQVVLTGRLVDATWFFSSKVDLAGQDQVTRAINRMAAGTPAGLLPEGAGKPEELWYLMTNATALAPYAGKAIKVEGRRLSGIRAIEPVALYVKDGEEWREVQLREKTQKGVPPQGAGTGLGDKHGASPSSQESTVYREAKHGEATGAEHGAGGATQSEAASSEQAEGPAAEHGDAGAKHDEGTDAHGGMEDKKESQRGHGGGGEGEHKGQEQAHEKGHEHGFEVLLALPQMHPILVNFTAGLFPIAVLADWLGRLLRRKSLLAAAWWMLLFAAAITPFTALAGWLWYRQVGDMGHVQMHIHPWLGLALALLLPALAVWRGRIYARDQEPSCRYLISATVLLLALIVQGHLGGTMSFPPQAQQSASAPGHVH